MDTIVERENGRLSNAYTNALSDISPPSFPRVGSDSISKYTIIVWVGGVLRFFRGRDVLFLDKSTL